MKTMLEIAYNKIQNEKKAYLKDIFNEVVLELMPYWKKRFTNKEENEIKIEKMGSLFSLLTTDGRFIMLEENLWTTSNLLTSKELAIAKSKIIIETEVEKIEN